MKVGELLRKLASSTGLIVCSDSSKIPEVAVIQTRTISLHNLLAGLAAGAPDEPAPELAIQFEKIFETMKVPASPHGWSAKSVATYLQSKEMAILSRQEAKQALLRVLQENKVPLEDILTDAVNRDKALDAYEEYAYKKFQERTVRRENDVAALEKEIAACEERIRQAKKQQKQDEAQYQEWLKKKIAEEEQLVKAVSMITNESTISVGSVNDVKRKEVT